MSGKIRVVQMGLGPVGLRVTSYLRERGGIEIVGALDVDQAKVGRDLGELAGGEALGVAVTDDTEGFLSKSDAQVVVHTTVSSLAKAEPQLIAIMKHGKSVVSTCEELSYPWKTQPGISARLDEAAKTAGVSLLGTGVNPGFLMDFLPIALTAVCREVRAVTVRRIQNAEFRRVPFQRKIGAGLTLEEFEAKKRDGTLRHVGLTESMHMIAAALGWELERTEDVIEPIVAESEIAVGAVRVPAGHAAGVQQTGRGFAGGREVITLEFRAAIGEPDPREEVELDSDPPIRYVIAGGVHGDVATCAIIANAVPAVLKSPPGLRTMIDIAPVSCAALRCLPAK